MSTLASATLAIAMIAAFILIGAGIRLALRRDDRQRGILMAVAGLVIVGNVLVWTI